MHTGFRLGNQRKRDHLEDIVVDGMIILRWMFKNWAGENGLDLSGLG